MTSLFDHILDLLAIAMAFIQRFHSIVWHLFEGSMYLRNMVYEK